LLVERQSNVHGYISVRVSWGLAFLIDLVGGIPQQLLQKLGSDSGDDAALVVIATTAKNVKTHTV
jgi:hypothetical protein